jgi:CheY-like chemotaxis protein
LALLAVRKLLLADDTITIQKIVALTFADQGIEVTAVGSGTEAIEHLRENSPDIVLADVFMPGLTGYQVCEHIKQTESLKHIPVMLLIGSFEPFDEAEARRVGADDILTKPFSSIRTLMDKVGALLGRAPAVDHSQQVSAPADIDPDDLSATLPGTAVSQPAIAVSQDEPLSSAAAGEPGVEPPCTGSEKNTKELPPPEVVQPPEEPMTSEELEITTADTQRLSPEHRERLEQIESVKAEETVLETTIPTFPLETNVEAPVEANVEVLTKASDEVSPVVSPQPYGSFGDRLLDLDQFERPAFGEDEDVILDIDFDAMPDDFAAPVRIAAEATVETSVEAPAYAHAFSSPRTADRYIPKVERQDADELPEPEFAEPLVEPLAMSEVATTLVENEAIAVAPPAVETATDSLAQPELRTIAEPQQVSSEAASQSITLAQLSPEVVDAIVRRVVEQMSAKAVQEIAWEVVPQLADLMIKRQLEERETQNK